MFSFTCELQQLCSEPLPISIATVTGGTKDNRNKLEKTQEMYHVSRKVLNKYPNKALARWRVWIPVSVKQPTSKANNRGNQEKDPDDRRNIGLFGVVTSI